MSSTASSTTGRGFEMSVEAERDDLILCLRGDVDVSVAATVLAAVEAGAGMDGCRRLVFELSEVTFVDSAGTDLLIRAAMLQELAAGAIVVRNPSGVVRRALESMRLTNLIPIESCPPVDSHPAKET